jgi:hypothetical protein
MVRTPSILKWAAKRPQLNIHTVRWYCALSRRRGISAKFCVKDFAGI